MSWKCPDCGSPNDETLSKCAVCGFCESHSLSLTFRSGKCIQVNIATNVGCDTWKSYDEDAKFMDKQQFSLEQDSDNNWQIIPKSSTTNETILNNKAISVSATLKDGDVLGVGREAKGIFKLGVSISLSG